MNTNAIKLLVVAIAATIALLAPNVDGQASCPHEQVIDNNPCGYCRGLIPCPPGSTGLVCTTGTASKWLNLVSGTYNYTKAYDLGPVNIQCTVEQGICVGGVCTNRVYAGWCYRSFSTAYVQVTCE